MIPGCIKYTFLWISLPALAVVLSGCFLFGSFGDDNSIEFDLSGGNTMETTASHFETSDLGACRFFVYNLNRADGTGPVVGNFSNVVGPEGHVGFAQWLIGPGCSTFNAEITIDEHKYTLNGDVSHSDLGGPSFPFVGIATGEWTREDGSEGAFTAFPHFQ